MFDLDTVPLVSADSHVAEPLEIFQERLPSHLRDDAPRVVEDGGRRRFEFPGLDKVLGPAREPKRDKSFEDEEFSAEEIKRRQKYERLAEATKRTPDLEARLRDSDADGILGEVIHPNLGLNFGVLEPELGAAMMRVYNEWLYEALGRSPRIVTPFMLPMWDIDGALEELDHAIDRGVRAANIPAVPGARPYNSQMWEPLWQKAAEHRITFVMHNGTGHPMVHYRGLGSGPVNLARTGSLIARALGLLACSGVMERYPDLHFVGVECGGGWFAWMCQVMDEAYGKLWQYPRLAQMPSEYMKRQAHVTFQDDPVAVHNVALTGPDVLLWGSDYPHVEGTWPESRAYVKKLFADLPIEDTAKIVGGTAAKLFGLEHVLPVATG